MAAKRYQYKLPATFGPARVESKTDGRTGLTNVRVYDTSTAKLVKTIGPFPTAARARAVRDELREQARERGVIARIGAHQWLVRSGSRPMWHLVTEFLPEPARLEWGWKCSCEAGSYAGLVLNENDACCHHMDKVRRYAVRDTVSPGIEALIPRGAVA